MNKKIENFILIIFILIVMGSFFALSRYIIFIPKFKDLKNIKSESAVLQNKQYNIWFLKNNWQYESINCLVELFVESEIKNLAINWLNIIQDEELIKDKIILQSVIISGKIVYLSFDQNFLNYNSTEDNFNLISSLLRTFFEAGFKDYSVYFLVHHKHINDLLLDFSIPWPTSLFYLN